MKIVIFDRYRSFLRLLFQLLSLSVITFHDLSVNQSLIDHIQSALTFIYRHTYSTDSLESLVDSAEILI